MPAAFGRIEARLPSDIAGTVCGARPVSFPQLWPRSHRLDVQAKWTRWLAGNIPLRRALVRSC